MRKQYKTKCTSANWLHACILFAFALLSLIAPIVCLALSFKTVKPGDIFAIAAVFGVFFCIGLAFAASGVACLRATLFPKTLQIKNHLLQLYRGEKQLGQIPFGNIVNIRVKTRAMAGETVEGEFIFGMLGAGVIGGLIRSSRFDPNETIGLIVTLRRSNDSDTDWPRRLFQKKRHIEILLSWELSHHEVLRNLKAHLLKYETSPIECDDLGRD